MTIKSRTKEEEYLGAPPAADPEEGEVDPFALEGTDFEVDLTDIDCPDGVYPARVEHVEVKTSVTGNRILSIRYRTLESKYSLFDTIGLGPASRWKLVGTLRALGFGMEGPTRMNTAMLINLPCRVQVTHESYEGMMRARVKTLLPADDATLRLAEVA